MIGRIARHTALFLALVATLLVACSKAPETDEALMKSGLDALYARADATAASAQFRKVLQRNPKHYGATYQLAAALDRGGKQDEARPYWEKALAMAEANRDDQTAATARTRLGKPAPGPEEIAMKAGLDALYRRGDAAGAAAEFRKVLQQNPTHYGATYQLAAALDRAGNSAEARPLWEKVLKMAEGYKDTETTTAARKRLAQRP